MRSCISLRASRRSISGQIYRTYLEDVPRLTPELLAQRIVDLDGWVDWNLRRGVSEIATNTYWRALRAFFNDW